MIWKTNVFACDRSHLHPGIDRFCITVRKLITPIELQYYVKLRANFILSKFENLSICFDRQSIISRRFSMWWDENDQAIIFQALNVLLMLKFNMQMFGTLFSPSFSMKRCSNDYNQMLDEKLVREGNRLTHILIIISKYACCWWLRAFFCSLLVGAGRFFFVVVHFRSLLVVFSRFRLF